MIKIGAAYFLFMNLAAFLAMKSDKKRAVERRWRVPEKKLFLIALAGGSIGTLAGMWKYRHKTKHMRFVIGIPLILAMQASVCLWVLFG